MTTDEIKAAITRGFESGLEPRAGCYIGKTGSGRFCGCAQGAMYIGLGNDPADWRSARLEKGTAQVLGITDEMSIGIDYGFYGDPLPKDMTAPDHIKGHVIGLWARETFYDPRITDGEDDLE